jgi:hypothetical protein
MFKVISYQENVNKNQMKCHFTPIKMMIIFFFIAMLGEGTL